MTKLEYRLVRKGNFIKQVDSVVFMNSTQLTSLEDCGLTLIKNILLIVR
jgi:hypothetical protein